MAKTYKIYTAGKMAGLSKHDQMAWRNEIESIIRDKGVSNVKFIHPPNYYDVYRPDHDCENEARMWDLNQIRDSDVVIVDLSTISNTIGTHIELGFIEAMNQFGSKHIYVIGVGSPDTEHPWINLALHRHEERLEDAADYIVKYLLV